MGCARASLGSLSESSRVFKAELLREVIAELGEQLESVASDERLSQVPHTLTAVDGSLLDALPLLVEAMHLNHTKGMRDHRVHADQSVDRSQADTANL